MREFASEHKMKVHLDGARVMNAAVALGVPPAEITQYVDSANICLSKVSAFANNKHLCHLANMGLW